MKMIHYVVVNEESKRSYTEDENDFKACSKGKKEEGIDRCGKNEEANTEKYENIKDRT